MPVLWQQWINNFDSTSAGTGCTINVDSSAAGVDKYKITSTIASATDGSDFAYAVETTDANLPSNDQGRIKFKFRTPATAWTNNLTILAVRNREGTPLRVIEIYLEAGGGPLNLGCFSDAGTLRSTSLNAFGATELALDAEYTIEVAWLGDTASAGYRRVYLNGVLELETTGLDMVAADDCDTGEVRLGIDHYDGSDSVSKTVKIRHAQISDDAATAITDPGGELLCKKITFTLTTSAGEQPITGVGLGGVGKAAFFWTSQQNVEGYSPHANIAIGAATSSSNRWARAANSEDNVASSDDDCYGTVSSALAGIVTASGSLGFTFDFISWDGTDGNFTINKLLAPAANITVHALIFGGSDLTNVAAVATTFVPGTGLEDAIEIGFTPDAILMGWIGRTVQGSVQSHYRIGIGAAANNNGTTQQAASFVIGTSGSSAGDAKQWQRTDSCILLGTGEGRISLNSWITNGVRFSKDEAVSDSYQVGILAFKGGAWGVLSDTQKSATGAKARAGLGFQPQGQLAVGCNAVANTALDSTQGRLSIGAADALGNEGAVWNQLVEGADPTQTARKNVTSKVFVHATADATTNAEADRQSFDLDGYTWNWTTADGAAREFWSLLFGTSTTSVTEAATTTQVIVHTKVESTTSVTSETATTTQTVAHSGTESTQISGQGPGYGDGTYGGGEYGGEELPLETFETGITIQVAVHSGTESTVSTPGIITTSGTNIVTVVHVSGGVSSTTESANMLLLALLASVGTTPEPVPDPGPAPGPGVTVRRRRRIVPKWVFVLARSSDLQPLAELHGASARRLRLFLNDAGTAECNFPLEGEIVTLVSPVETCLIAIREGKYIWSGPVWTTEEDAAASNVSIRAVGWFELLNHRFVGQKVSYTDVDAGQIALNLLDIANLSFPTGITNGPLQPSFPRTRAYQGPERVGEAIRELSDIENGFDWYVNPRSRQLEISVKRGEEREHVVFGYGSPPENLGNVQRTIQGSELANSVLVSGNIGTPQLAQDSSSINRYGFFEDRIVVSDSPGGDVLQALAGSEVLFRNTPRVIYNIVPNPASEIGNVPLAFDEYDLGDTVEFRASYGGLQIPSQPVRIFGIDVQIDDDNNERIERLVTSL